MAQTFETLAGQGEGSEKQVTHLGSGDGRMVPLSEWPCGYCGDPGCTHIFLHATEASFAFCSWEHLQAGIRINDQPITEELLTESGAQVIGPRPEA
jgi:hypothetical protein